MYPWQQSWEYSHFHKCIYIHVHMPPACKQVACVCTHTHTDMNIHWRIRQMYTHTWESYTKVYTYKWIIYKQTQQYSWKNSTTTISRICVCTQICINSCTCAKICMITCTYVLHILIHSYAMENFTKALGDIATGTGSESEALVRVCGWDCLWAGVCERVKDREWVCETDEFVCGRECGCVICSHGY